MARLYVIFLGIALLPMFGCNGDKIAHLEKENADLKAQIAKENAATDFDLQAKCSTAAKNWFNENWATTSREKATSYLDHSNHYNNASNKCFVFVEYHFNMSAGLFSSWMNDMTLWDVFENSKYGTFSEKHDVDIKTGKTNDRIETCEMLDKKCSSIGEFNGLVQPYMNN